MAITMTQEPSDIGELTQVIADPKSCDVTQIDPAYAALLATVSIRNASRYAELTGDFPAAIAEQQKASGYLRAANLGCRGLPRESLQQIMQYSLSK